MNIGDKKYLQQGILCVLQLGVGQETVLDIHSDQEGERMKDVLKAYIV